MCAYSVKCIVFNVLRLPDVIADTVAVELVGSCMEMKVNRPLVEVYYEAMTHIPTVVPVIIAAPFAHASTRLLASSVRLLLVERIK